MGIRSCSPGVQGLLLQERGGSHPEGSGSSRQLCGIHQQWRDTGRLRRSVSGEWACLPQHQCRMPKGAGRGTRDRSRSPPEVGGYYNTLVAGGLGGCAPGQPQRKTGTKSPEEAGEPGDIFARETGGRATERPEVEEEVQALEPPVVSWSPGVRESGCLDICLYSRAILHLKQQALLALRASLPELRASQLDECEASVASLWHPGLGEYRNHSGQHIGTMAIIDELPAFQDVRAEVLRRIAEVLMFAEAVAARRPLGWLVLGFKCRGGILQSVAAVELLAQQLRYSGHRVHVLHVSHEQWPPNCSAGTCGQCEGANVEDS